MTKKKLYKKSEIKRVKLVPKEAVLASCKNDTAPGAIGQGANKCGDPSPSCKAPGS